MTDPEIFSYITKENIQLHATLHRANRNRKNLTILYFHGGGLLYGISADLPEIYINEFLNSGYNFLTLDYPLAPETKLNLILKSTFELLSFYLKNFDTIFSLESNAYVLMGRSAGSYICFMMYDRLIKNKISLPKALISLYGYARLDEAEFNTPNKYYKKLAIIPDESIKKIISDQPVTYGPMNLRFCLYIKARQEGTWIQQLCGTDDPQKYSLSDETLTMFPPTILAAATLDPDVPYRISKTLSKRIPNAHLITIYQDIHDFDRDIHNAAGKATYEEIIKWLENKR